jgi:hypothetical protein
MLRDLLAVYRSTWREGLPMLSVLPTLWIIALCLEVLP